MRTVLCLALVVVFAGACYAEQGPPPSLSVPSQEQPKSEAAVDLTGVYEVAGEAADGKPYTSFAEITRIGNTYEVLWVVSEREAYLGFGLVQGDSLAVSVLNMPTVVLYKIEGQRLVGKWTVPNKEGRVFSEVLTKTDKELSLPSPPNNPSPPPSPSRRSPSLKGRSATI